MTKTEISPEAITGMLTSAAQEVFTSMLGVNIAETEPSSAGAQRVAADGVLSFVGLTGACVGTGFLWCSRDVARDLASRLLMTESQVVDDEVLDAFGELTNMIIGSAKNLLEDLFGAVQMSIPTAVCGKNISMRHMGSDITIPVRCTYEAGELMIGMCFSMK